MKRLYFLPVLLLIFGLCGLVIAQMNEFTSARAAADRGDYKGAVDIMEKLVIKNIDDADQHKFLIDCYVKGDLIDQFAEFYKGLKLNFPGNRVLTRELPEYFYNLGLQNKTSGNFVLAFGYFSVVDNLKRNYQDVESELFYCKRKAEAQKKEQEGKRLAEESYKAGEDAYWKGQFFEAAENFKKVMASQPAFKEKANEWMFRANKDYNLGKYDMAASGFLVTVTLDIDNADAHKKLISSLIKLERIGDISKVYQSFKGDFPDNPGLTSILPQYFFDQGKDALGKQNHVAALGNFEVVRILKGNFNNVEALMASCKAEVEKGEKLKKGKDSYANAEKLFEAAKYKEALSALKQALQYDPTFRKESAQWFRSGAADLDARKSAVAIERFKMSIALDPAQAEAHKALVELYIDTETLDEFKNVYTDLKNDIRNPVMTGILPEYLYNKGLEFKTKSDFQLAKRCFEMSQYFVAGYKDAVGQSRLCDEGIARMKNAREAQKEYLTADAAFKAGKLEKALEGLAKAAQLDPVLRGKAAEWYKQGQQKAEAGLFRDALPFYRAAIALDFGTTEAHTSLVKAFIEQNDLAGLKAVYDGYIKQNADHAVITRIIPQAVFEQGNALKGKQKFAEAKLRFEIAQYFSPNYVDVQRNIAACEREIARLADMEKRKGLGQQDFEQGFNYLKADNFLKAKEAFTAAVKNYPDYAEFKTAVTWGMFKVSTEINRGMYKEAIAKLEVIAVLDPANVGLHEKLISSYRKTADEPRLQRTYGELKALYPDNKVLADSLPLVFYANGKDLRQKNQFELAIKEFELVTLLGGAQYRDVTRQIQECRAEIERLKKAEENMKLAKDCYADGVKASKTNDWAIMITSFRKASSYDPKYQELASDWIYKADEAARTSRHQDAVSYYKVALALNCDDAKAHTGLLNVLKKLGRTEQEKVYGQLKLDYPSSRVILDTLPAQAYKEGLLLKQNKDFRLAIEKFKEVQFFNPNFAGLAQQLKECNDEIAKAEQIERNRKMSKEAYERGMTLFQQGKITEAAIEFRGAARLNPQMEGLAEDWAGKGRTQVKMNKSKEAINYYQVAIALNPDYKDAHLELVNLFYDLKMITALKQFYADLEKIVPGNKTINQDLPQFYYDAGVKQKETRNFEEALQSLRIATTLKENYRDAAQHIAVCETEIRRLAQLEANRAKAKESYNRALDAYGKNQIDAAINGFFEAVAMDASHAKNAAAWQEKGKLAFKTNNFNKALNDYRVAVALDPEMFDAQVGLIRIWLNDSQMDKLKLFYTEVLKRYASSKTVQEAVPEVFQEALLHKQDTDYELAIEKLDVVLFLNKSFKDAAAQIQICRNEIEKRKLAKVNMQKATEMYEAAEALFNKRQFTEAFAKFDEVVGLDVRYKSYSEDWFERGAKSSSVKNYRDAINAYKVSIILNNESAKSHTSLIESYIGLNVVSELETYYAGIKVKFPASPVLNRDLPDYFYKAGEVSIKDEDYEKALLYFGLVRTLNNSYRDLGQKINFCNTQMSLTVNKKKARENYDKGLAAVEKGNYPEATDWFEKAKALDQVYASYLDKLKDEGMQDYNVGKYNIAAKKLGMVVLANVKDMELHKMVIEAGIRSGTMEYLSSLYEKIKIEFPFEPVVRRSLPDYFYNRAIAHKTSKELPTALSELQIVQVLNPGYKDVDAQIADIKKNVNK